MVNTLLHFGNKNQTVAAEQGNNHCSEIHKQHNNAKWAEKEHLNVKSDSIQISHLAQESYRLIYCDTEYCISQVSLIFIYEGAPQRLY